jgi:hypothetical protein
MRKTYLVVLGSYGNEKKNVEEALLTYISSKADSFGFTTEGKSTAVESFSGFLIDRQEMDVSWINEEDDAELTDLESQEKWAAYKFTLNKSSLELLKSTDSDHDFFFYSNKEAFAKKARDDSYELVLEDEEVEQVKENLISAGLREEDFFKL